MAEDDFSPIREGRYRGSRYAGFATPTGAVGGGTPSGAGGSTFLGALNTGRADGGTSLAAQKFDIPKPIGMGDVAAAGASAAGGYAATKIGTNVGEFMAGGAGFGDALGGGVAQFGVDVKEGISKAANWLGGAKAADTAQAGASGAGSSGATATGTSLAEQSFGDRLTSGSNLGGAAGAGIARAGIGLITGEKPATALSSGAGSALGYALGNAVMPGLGGIIGGTAGGFLGKPIQKAVRAIASFFGGRVICTELAAMGLLSRELLEADLRFTRAHISPITVRGYHAWAVPYVRLMRRSPMAVRLIEPIARWRAEELAYRMGVRPRGSLPGKLVRLALEPLCFVIGLFVAETDWSTLYRKESADA